MKTKHTPNERARIHASSGLALDTIRAIERGENVREASRLRYDRACVEEGIDPCRAFAQFKNRLCEDIASAVVRSLRTPGAR